MRDYSKSPYEAGEVASAFTGVCKALGKTDYYCPASLPLVGQEISKVAAEQGIEIAPTGDVAKASQNLQELITHILDSNLVSFGILKQSIDNELMKLPYCSQFDFFQM